MRWLAILLSMGLLFAALEAPALAQGEAQFRGHVDTGIKLYDAQSYEKAAAEFRAAYQIKAVPNLLFNIARCQEKLGKVDLAMETYREFLSVPGTDSVDRSKALKFLSALEEEKAMRAKVERQDSTVATVEPTAEPDPKTTTTVKETVTVRPEPAGRSRALEWTLIGVGSAALVTGAVFGGLALDQNSQLDDAKTYEERVEKRDAVKRDALVADIGIGVGAAAVLTGTLLYVLRPDTDAGSATMILPSTDGAGVGLSAFTTF